MKVLRSVMAGVLTLMIIGLTSEIAKVTGKFSYKILWALAASHIVALVLGATIAWWGF